MTDLSEWKQAFTDDNEPYYYNVTTEETSWEPPEGWTAVTDAVPTMVPAELPVEPEIGNDSISTAVQDIAEDSFVTDTSVVASGVVDQSVSESPVWVKFQQQSMLTTSNDPQRKNSVVSKDNKRYLGRLIYDAVAASMPGGT